VKAVVLHGTGGPEALKVEEVPVPEPGPTELLVKVAACGVCGHDQADRLGLTHVDRPVVLGHEISGTVVAVGGRVRHFGPGDRVAARQFYTCGRCFYCRAHRDLECPLKRFNYGGYAEYAVLDEESAVRVPDNVDLVGASIVACAVGTCLKALKYTARVAPGEWVVVTGAGGGLGIHGVQVAKSLGARVVAVTSSPGKADRIAACGADRVVVAQGPDYWQQVFRATDGRGADVVLDNVGHPELFGPCFRALARGGRYVFTGQIYRAKVELYPAFVFGKEALITGSASTRMADFIEAMELVGQGKVRPVFELFDLEAAAEAHRRVDNRQVFGRAILVPQGVKDGQEHYGL
jgi:acryloyl-coenzyme A reductase